MSVDSEFYLPILSTGTTCSAVRCPISSTGEVSFQDFFPYAGAYPRSNFGGPEVILGVGLLPSPFKPAGPWVPNSRVSDRVSSGTAELFVFLIAYSVFAVLLVGGRLGWGPAT